MVVKYVKEFKFPSDGKARVRAYDRAAPVVKPKMDPNVMGEGVGPLSGRKLGGYAKGGDVKSKVGVVMKEFGKGDLHSGSSKGPLVKNPKQAMAIALSEARDAGAKTPVKKATGGMMHGGMMHDGYAKGGKSRC